MQSTVIRYFAWISPLLCYASDANAWGLYTHLHFAQHLILTLPLLDPRLRRVAKQLPHLVLAGACLPDLALVSRQFSTTHQWQQVSQMLASADTDEQLALTIGYTSHLYVDILAHNHFVPAFEAKWMHYSVVTHVVSEWAMDAHIAATVQQRPFSLIRKNLAVTSQFVSKHFETTPTRATRALKQLAWADKLLRVSGISRALLSRIRYKDSEFTEKLNYYLQQAYAGLHQFEAVLHGDTPKIHAELNHLSATEMHTWREKCVTDLRMRLNTPIHAFHDYHEQFKLPQ